MLKTQGAEGLSLNQSAASNVKCMVAVCVHQKAGISVKHMLDKNYTTKRTQELCSGPY